MREGHGPCATSASEIPAQRSVMDATTEIKDAPVSGTCPRCKCELAYKGAKQDGRFFWKMLVTYYQCPKCAAMYGKG